MNPHVHPRFCYVRSATWGMDCVTLPRVARPWPRWTALTTRRPLVSSGITTTAERICTFEPSVWTDFFIRYEPEQLQISEECMSVKANKLKEEINLLFKSCKSTMVEKMTLLDTLQRLGIDHLFQGQINVLMNEIHKSEFKSCCLNEVALRFRLLREHGLWVSPDVFDKFKGEDGMFSKAIMNDAQGLLSLYNAAYLSTNGELELDEAITFARHHLESMSGSLKYPLSEQVRRNLEIPLPRTLKRLDAPYYIVEYKQERAYNPYVLELAKLEFNLLQHLHQRELKELCQWGNDLYEEVGLSYSRHRTVETYLWCYTIYYEKHFADARIILAKICHLVSLLDDTFDMQATLEEGQKLNEAIQRWDESAIPILPEYLKKYYVKLIKTFRELEDELKEDHKYRMVYCRKAFQTLCKHYQKESEWFHSSYIPSFEEHIKNSVISTSTPTIVIASLIGMEDEATKEAFEWVIRCTDAVKACAEVARFMNDMTAFEHGKNKKDMACSVESYINQYHVTNEVAMAAIEEMVEDAWKTINQTRFDRREMLPLVERITRLTKSMILMYHGNINLYTFTNGIKERIKEQFIEPIPL
ncbi:hypothetical protein ACQJBY_014288 [Aegilops geniculata]